MTRVKTSIYIDDRLRRAAKEVTIRSGLKEYEVHEEALRMYLGWDRLEALLDRHTNLTEEWTAAPDPPDTALSGRPGH